jgi:hypothetical protein
MRILLGPLTILLGLLIKVTPGFHDPINVMYFDISGFNRPAGIIMIAAGATLILRFLAESS